MRLERAFARAGGLLMAGHRTPTCAGGIVASVLGDPARIAVELLVRAGFSRSSEFETTTTRDYYERPKYLP